MNANQVMQTIDKIKGRYNGDFDLPPKDVPLVTWTDMELLEIIIALIHRIDGLERREIQKYRRENQP